MMIPSSVPPSSRDSVPHHQESHQDGPSGDARVLSEADCLDIAQRLARAAHGVGYTATIIWSVWSGHVRWARNQISTSGEVRNTYIRVSRDLRGANHGVVLINETTDTALVAAARRAERLAQLEPEKSQWELPSWYQLEPMTAPQLFSESTFQMDAEHRADAALQLIKSAAAAGIQSAGYLEVAAHTLTMIDTLGHMRHTPYTTANYSVTVRDPSGRGSGWAGVDWQDWNKIDGAKLSKIALDKCLQSRNPVALEPGRYRTILEPQAVSELIGQLFSGVFRDFMDKGCSVGDCGSASYPFFESPASDDTPGMSRLGKRVADERITISSDPMDPELGFPPFNPCAWPGVCYLSDWMGADVFHPTTWIKNGVLTALEYHRDSFVGDDDGARLGVGLPKAGGFRMSGGTTTIEEMIATTPRGVLVTRFDNILAVDRRSLLMRGYTRDGLWLIENGKISHPIKNFMFVESILFALNNVEDLGVPQRTYHPQSGKFSIPQPAIVPPLKIRDFNFVGLSDAV